jgi:hypothetical protein
MHLTLNCYLEQSCWPVCAVNLLNICMEVDDIVHEEIADAHATESLFDTQPIYNQVITL